MENVYLEELRKLKKQGVKVVQLNERTMALSSFREILMKK